MTTKKERAARPRAALPSKTDILAFVQSSQSAVGKREIARAFGIKGSERIELKRLMKELASDGLISDPKRKIQKNPLSSVAVIIVIGQDRHGDLIGKPLHWSEAEDGSPPPIRIEITKQYDGASIGAGDHVLARLQNLSTNSDGLPLQLIAFPIKKIAKVKPRQLGILRKTTHGFVIESLDKKDLKEIFVTSENVADAADGDLVRFEMSRDSKTGRMAGIVSERIGSPKAEKAISLIAIHNHGLRDQFSDDVIKDVENLPPLTVPHGTDLTNIPLVTIDPADAKDHDDAVWAEMDRDPENEGGCIVIVAIADVSFYVRFGTSIDHEARLRGNSVYFPDQVVPMLPEHLSNDLCSLREGELRPCLAVRMVFDRYGKKRSHRFMRGLMRSVAKLSYQQAQAAIDGNADDKTQPLLDTVLRPLWQVYAILKDARDKRGPLDLDLPERKIILDKQGLVAQVIVPQRLDAHRLIEEFMIQANVAAAEALEVQKTPLIYRVHDAPSVEKLAALSEFLTTLGINVPKTGFKKPSQFNSIIERATKTEHEELLNEIILRSQAQAEYRENNLGHFGLNLRRYAHFTSPIRRYADLIVHRALIGAFNLGAGGLSDVEKLQLSSTAETISQAERKAMSAERETTDRLIAMHLAERVGDRFLGRISGVTRFGLFVKLNDTGADGFIPVATLGRDYYRHVENAYALVGERTGESYRMGDKVEIRLVEANPSAGALRFEMESDGRYVKDVARMSRKKNGSKPPHRNRTRAR